MERPLASWRDTATRTAIIDFVAGVADGSSSVPPDERIAVFDNDGTLWSEKPLPVQAQYILEQWAAQAAADPSLADTQPYTGALSGDLSWLAGAMNKHYAGDDSDVKVAIAAIVASSASIPVEDYARDVAAFFARARHPVLGCSYSLTVYRPMVELLHYLEKNGFTCYIASAGGRDFMRPITEEYYGIPAERVIGSAVGLEYRADNGGGHVVHGDTFAFLDDGKEKPVRIWSRVGRRPILTAGNSNGDIPMLSYAQGNERSLSILVHHDDPDRGDIPYDTGAEIALATATERGWTTVSIKDDWEVVFPDAGR